jgi:predicted MPP superfamily phosphohydrolase
MNPPSYYLFWSSLIASTMMVFYFVAIRRWVFMSSEIQRLYQWSYLAAVSSSVTILYVFQDVPFVFRGYLFSLLALWLYLVTLVRPAARHSAIFRVLVVFPAHYALSAAFYVLPFALIYVIFPAARKIVVIPLFAAFFSVLLAIIPPRDDAVHLIADTTTPFPDLSRVRTALSPPDALKPDLVVYQIADAHIGAFATAADIAAICQKAVEARPDVIVITGDMISFEATHMTLSEALHPLSRYQGKVVACLGDRDQHHEAIGIIRNVYSSKGIQLIEDEQVKIELAEGRGSVTIISSVYQTPENSDRYTRALLDAERPAEVAEEKNIRLFIAHDPTAFASVKDDDKIDLMLSGHTHGGFWGVQGVNSAAWMIFKMPDNGAWRRGRTHLYVHRGQGVSGFPLRLGIWNETGLLNLYLKTSV